MPKITKLSKFVKVMQKKLWPLFFRTRCRFPTTFVHLPLHAFTTAQHVIRDTFILDISSVPFISESLMNLLSSEWWSEGQR